MNERTLSLKLLVSDQLEELADMLDQEKTRHDTERLRATAKYLSGPTISFDEKWRMTQA
jgi:hypothetical protein